MSISPSVFLFVCVAVLNDRLNRSMAMAEPTADSDPWNLDRLLSVDPREHQQASSDPNVDNRDPWDIDAFIAHEIPTDQPLQIVNPPLSARAANGTRRRRGRPAGLAGNPAQRRAIHAAAAAHGRHGQLALALRPETSVPQPPAVKSSSTQLLNIQTLLRPLNGFVGKVSAVLRSISIRKHKPGRQTVKIVESILGDEVRPMTSVRSEAERLGDCQQKVGNKLQHFGASVFFTDRIWFPSILSDLISRHINANDAELISTFRYTKYDETPLVLRAAESSPSLSNRILEDTTALSITNLSLDQHQLAMLQNAGPLDISLCGGNRYERKLGKLYSLRLHYGILLKIKSTGRFLSMDFPMSTSLAMADSNTSDNLKHIMDLNLEMPLWASFCSLAKHSFEGSTTDSADSNKKYERFEDLADERLKRLRKPCEQHLASNVAHKVYTPIAPTISGVAALFLLMKAAGATLKLRELLFEILLLSVVIVHCEPPGVHDARYMYRARVLDLCLDPDSSVDQRRRVVLESNLTGSWQGRIVEWHTPNPRANKYTFARQTAWALLPHQFEEFPRHRWLTKLGAFLDATLLSCCHGFLEYAVPLWVEVLNGLNRAVYRKKTYLYVYTLRNRYSENSEQVVL
jgi:hypothetical protein